MMPGRRNVKSCDSCLYVKNFDVIRDSWKRETPPRCLPVHPTVFARSEYVDSYDFFCELSPCNGCELLLESEEIVGMPKVINGPRIVYE